MKIFVHIEPRQTFTLAIFKNIMFNSFFWNTSYGKYWFEQNQNEQVKRNIVENGSTNNLRRSTKNRKTPYFLEDYRHNVSNVIEG